MPHYPQKGRVRGPQNCSGRFGEEQTFGPPKVEIRSSCPYCANYLALLCDDYFKYVGQIISNCHLSDDERIRIGLRYFGICTDIRIGQWFPVYRGADKSLARPD
jgi:hypothetical protein